MLPMLWHFRVPHRASCAGARSDACERCRPACTTLKHLGECMRIRIIAIDVGGGSSSRNRSDSAVTDVE